MGSGEVGGEGSNPVTEGDAESGSGSGARSAPDVGDAPVTLAATSRWYAAPGDVTPPGMAPARLLPNVYDVVSVGAFVAAVCVKEKLLLAARAEAGEVVYALPPSADASAPNRCAPAPAVAAVLTG